MAFWVGPERRAHGRSRMFGLSLGPIAVNKQHGVAFQHAKFNIKHAGIKGYERTRMQTSKVRKSRLQYDLTKTEEPGYMIEEIPCSLVALFEGPADNFQDVRAGQFPTDCNHQPKTSRPNLRVPQGTWHTVILEKPMRAASTQSQQCKKEEQ